MRFDLQRAGSLRVVRVETDDSPVRDGVGPRAERIEVHHRRGATVCRRARTGSRLAAVADRAGMIVVAARTIRLGGGRLAAAGGVAYRGVVALVRARADDG